MKDVRAICNVNASMKGAGQTGHKAWSRNTTRCKRVEKGVEKGVAATGNR